jgi:hypothetical protein
MLGGKRDRYRPVQDIEEIRKDDQTARVRARHRCNRGLDRIESWQLATP